MVRLVALIAATASLLFSGTATAVAPSNPCSINAQSCDLPRYKPFLLLKNYQPAKTWCASKYPVRPVTVTKTKTITKRDELEDRAFTSCRATDYLCQIFEHLKTSNPDLQAAICSCLQGKPQTKTVTKTKTVTAKRYRRALEPEIYERAIPDTCPVDNKSCQLPQYMPFALLKSYDPAKRWCASKYPLKPVTSTITSTATTTVNSTQPGITQRAELEERTGSGCRSDDYRCSIFQNLQSGPTTFAAAICSCLQGKPSTTKVTVTTTRSITVTAPTDNPTPTACSALSPSPGNLTCGKNYICSGQSNYKLIKIGDAGSVMECAKDCKSTSSCLSFAFSAPQTGGVAICDLYSGSVSDLKANAPLVEAPSPAGQDAQEFFDIGCFGCPEAGSTTQPAPITTPSPTPSGPPVCNGKSPPPSSSDCNVSLVYVSESRDNLLKLGQAADPKACASDCKSTLNCVSFSFRDASDGGQGRCDLYSATVQDMKDNAVLGYSPEDNSQFYQQFYNLNCFSCEEAATTTSPPSLPAPTGCFTASTPPQAAVCNRQGYYTNPPSRRKLLRERGFALTATRCAAQCRRTLNCVSFSFYPSRCDLYSASVQTLVDESLLSQTGIDRAHHFFDLTCFTCTAMDQVPAAPLSDPNTATSAPVGCPAASVSNSSSNECGVYATGTQNEFVYATRYESVAASMSECASRCLALRGCLAFAYSESNSTSGSAQYSCIMYDGTISQMTAADAIRPAAAGDTGAYVFYNKGCFSCLPLPTCSVNSQASSNGLSCSRQLYLENAMDDYLQTGDSQQDVSDDSECSARCHTLTGCQSYAIRIVDNQRKCIMYRASVDLLLQHSSYSEQPPYVGALQLPVSDRDCYNCSEGTSSPDPDPDPEPAAATCELSESRPIPCGGSYYVKSTAHAFPGSGQAVASYDECAKLCYMSSGCLSFSVNDVGPRKCIRYTRTVAHLSQQAGDITTYSPRPGALHASFVDLSCYDCTGGGARACDGEAAPTSNRPLNTTCGYGVRVKPSAVLLPGAATTAGAQPVEQVCARRCITTRNCRAFAINDLGTNESPCLLFGHSRQELETLRYVEQESYTPTHALFDLGCYACGASLAGEPADRCDVLAEPSDGNSWVRPPFITTDQPACKQACNLEPACRAFASEFSRGYPQITCYLFRTSVEVLQNSGELLPVNFQTLGSYNYNDRACNPNPMPVQKCGYADVVNASIDRISGVSQVFSKATCAELCKTTPECLAYSVRRGGYSSGTDPIACYLFSKSVVDLVTDGAVALVNEDTGSVYDVSCVSEQPHSEVDDQCGVSAEPNGDLLVINPGGQPVDGAAACRGLCDAHPRCYASAMGQQQQPGNQGLCKLYGLKVTELARESAIAVQNASSASTLVYYDASCSSGLPPSCGLADNGTLATIDTAAIQPARLDRNVAYTAAAECAQYCTADARCAAYSYTIAVENTSPRFRCWAYRQEVARLLDSRMITRVPAAASYGVPYAGEALFYDRACATEHLPACGEHGAGTWIAVAASVPAAHYASGAAQELTLPAVYHCARLCLRTGDCGAWTYRSLGSENDSPVACILFRHYTGRLLADGDVAPVDPYDPTVPAEAKRLIFDRGCPSSTQANGEEPPERRTVATRRKARVGT